MCFTSKGPGSFVRLRRVQSTLTAKEHDLCQRDELKRMYVSATERDILVCFVLYNEGLEVELPLRISMNELFKFRSCVRMTDFCKMP